MTKKTKVIKITFIVFIIIVIVLILLNIISNSMLFLPKGNKVESIKSPNKDYTMNSYLIDGGALSADAIRVEIVYNNQNKSKDIYYSYSESEVTIEWVNDDTVKINNKKLNIHKDKYNNN